MVACITYTILTHYYMHYLVEVTENPKTEN
jgi:hypothetical protein